MLPKVLVINHNYNPISERINWGFIDKLAPYCREYERMKVCHYSVKYNRFWFTTTPEIINDVYKPDLIISHLNYHPAYNRHAEKFVRSLNGRKVWVVVDCPFKYGMEEYERYYKSCRFELAILRGHVKRDKRSVWLPYSVDTQYFMPYNGTRIPKVGFAGSVGHKAYDERKQILIALEKEKLLSRPRGWRMEGDDYPKFMRQHALAFTSTEFGNSRAKMYEFMAMGCALLSTPFREHRRLFDRRCWARVRSPQEAVKVARQLLDDDYHRQRLVDIALKQIEKYHTDTIRIRQFASTLKCFMEGKPLPRFFRR